MTWKGFLAAVFAVPALVAFGGIGILAYQIGQTWDARTTDSLISGMIAVCAGGVIMVAILLALIVGVPLALRTYEQGGRARQAWLDTPPMRVLPPGHQPGRIWHESPPLIEDKAQGTWQSQGPGTYDLWSDESASPRGYLEEDDTWSE